MLTEGLATLIPGNAGVASSLGTPTTRSDETTGFFPVIAVKEPTMPYIVYYQLSRRNVTSFAGVNPLQEARFRFSCYGSTYKQAKQLAEKLKLALDGFVGVLSEGTTVESTWPISEIDEAEPDMRGTVWSTHLDYYFWFLDTGQ